MNTPLRVLALSVLTFSLSACGNQDQPNNKPNPVTPPPAGNTCPSVPLKSCPGGAVPMVDAPPSCAQKCPGE